MKRFLLGLAVASWGLASASVASAATLIFDVSVDERRSVAGVDPSFSPFTFQQTWEIGSNPQYFQTSNGPGHIADVHYDVGDSVPGYSPLTSPIMDLIGLTGPHSSSYGVDKMFEYRGSSPPVGSYGFSLHDEVRTSVDLGGGKFLEKYYIRSMSGHGAYPVDDVGVLDEASVVRVLSHAGPLYWVEWGNASIHDTVTGTYSPIAQVNYFGTAQFVGLSSAVPEPMTWALMICGLGVVGVCLRRPEARRWRRAGVAALA